MDYKLFDVDQDEVPKNMKGIIAAVPYIDCGLCYFSLMQCPEDSSENPSCLAKLRKDKQEVMFVKVKYQQ